MDYKKLVHMYKSDMKIVERFEILKTTLMFLIFVAALIISYLLLGSNAIQIIFIIMVVVSFVPLNFFFPDFTLKLINRLRERHHKTKLITNSLKMPYYDGYYVTKEYTVESLPKEKYFSLDGGIKPLDEKNYLLIILNLNAKLIIEKDKFKSFCDSYEKAIDHNYCFVLSAEEFDKYYVGDL